MGKVVDPRGIRYGKVYDWNIYNRTVNNYFSNIKKKIDFEEYIRILFFRNLGVRSGLIYDSAKIYYKGNKVVIEVYIYDSQMENWLHNEFKGKDRLEVFEDKVVNKVELGKLAYFEKILQISGKKYFDKNIEVEFFGLDSETLSSQFIARYICIKLKQGYSLGELISNVRKNLNSLMHEGKEKLYGFRIDCDGRFSRRQRASFESIKEGRVSLNRHQLTIDYGCDEVALKYGVCNVRVWLNKTEKFENYSYRIKV